MYFIVTKSRVWIRSWTFFLEPKLQDQRQYSSYCPYPWAFYFNLSWLLILDLTQKVKKLEESLLQLWIVSCDDAGADEDSGSGWGWVGADLANAETWSPHLRSYRVNGARVWSRAQTGRQGPIQPGFTVGIEFVLPATFLGSVRPFHLQKRPNRA